MDKKKLKRTEECMREKPEYQDRKIRKKQKQLEYKIKRKIHIQNIYEKKKEEYLRTKKCLYTVT